MTPEDRKRADRAWEEMRRSHLRSAKLRVKSCEAALAEVKARLEARLAEIAVEEECDRGSRAAHLAMSLTHEDPEARAEHARKATEKRDTSWSDEHIASCRQLVAEWEARLERSRAELAEKLAERRADREWAKAVRLLYGAQSQARAGGQRA